jgi:hypothetical protein
LTSAPYNWLITDGGLFADAFKMIWNTNNGDVQPTVILPLVEGGTYSFTVEWGDGNSDAITSWDQSETTHTYASGGTYEVFISGTIEGWSFEVQANSANAQKLTQINKWGPLKLGNVGGYFENCSNLSYILSQAALDLTGVTDLSKMFRGCNSLSIAWYLD